MRPPPFQMSIMYMKNQKGATLLISSHWRQNMRSFFGLGRAFTAEGFLNRDLLAFSKNSQREWYKEAVYQIWFEAGQ